MEYHLLSNLKLTLRKIILFCRISYHDHVKSACLVINNKIAFYGYFSLIFWMGFNDSQTIYKIHLENVENKSYTAFNLIPSENVLPV
uniref:Uncharacterized protein n=1 Tax=Schistosoma haematobium TaxID=6185 RepID=A0A094ZDZ3_SCHHA